MARKIPYLILLHVKLSYLGMEGYLRVLAGPSGEEEGGGGGGAAWWECRGTADGLPAPFYFVLEGPRLFQGLPPGHEGGQEDSPSAGMPDRVERLVLTSETRVAAMAEDDSHCLGKRDADCHGMVLCGEGTWKVMLDAGLSLPGGCYL